MLHMICGEFMSNFLFPIPSNRVVRGKARFPTGQESARAPAAKMVNFSRAK